MKTILFACLLLSVNDCLSQPDTTGWFSRVEGPLKNGSATVSGILTDKSLMDLHPLTGFRELVSKYAGTQPVSIAPDDEPGKKIKVICHLKNENGKPVPGALVYLYQTDARGWYAADAPHVPTYAGDMRHARLFGYVKTDAQGRFELHTVKPSGYPQSDLPAHIHVHVEANGYLPLITEFLFDDDERLKGSIRRQAEKSNFLIAKPSKADLPFQQQFSYSLTLEKD